ncbi:MAG: FAD-dependent oxidoreductase [Candidatus Helarchaeota archaeon]
MVVGSVLVIGGGISGIQATLDLVELGFKAYLLEEKPSIGGIMGKLDKTFPTNDCSMCILAPKMVELSRNPNIELMTYSEVVKIEGNVGNFLVTIKKKPRYINATKCKSCGICSIRCPVQIPDEYNEALTVRSAIYIPFPQAVPSTYVIDSRYCLYLQKGVCRLCEKSCEAKAIDFNQKEEFLTIRVGGIIWAVGAEIFDVKNLSQYGYSKYDNVITSLEFERILNASGPFNGEVLRPSDHKTPQKVLWLNCIGSRNRVLGNDYCSSVCCMYSIKEAFIAKEHNPIIEPYIFFIDIRAVGKGFEEYYKRAKNSGINFIKARISILEEDPISKNIIVTYEDIEKQEIKTETFELVILSVGYQPKKSIELLKDFGIELNKYNFIATKPFAPLQTNKPGIFVCGTASAPKDIPETVAEASGAAAMVSSLLYTERSKLAIEKDYPPEKDIRFQNPRIGVFVCRCGINIGAVVDVPAVVEFAKTLPNVIYAEENLYTCSQDTQEQIKDIIAKFDLNRIVIASCTPRTHEALFQNTIREAGLNPYLFELVNIREQCSWVHMHEPEKATQKAKKLVEMTVAKAQLFRPIKELSIKIVQTGLVIGGGIAGMTAALELANQGFSVYLIEKEKQLGGIVNKIHYTLDSEHIQPYLHDLVEKVINSNRIITLFNTQIQSISGFIGNFKISLKTQEKKREIEVGTIIVATGGSEYEPSEYLYGEDSRVLTQLELEQQISHGTITARRLVMIQCVGSRNETRPYCSRICCASAVKNAIKLKSMNPEMEIIILHKDIRTYGFMEEYYKKSRELGVIYIRYEETNPPKVVKKEGKLQVEVFSLSSQHLMQIEPDLLVLSAAFIPANTEELAHMLKVPRDLNGFFLEAHVKLRPLDFATDGIFLCGCAQWPKFINETIAQAKGAAAKAAIVLAKKTIKVPGVVAEVNPDFCIGCGACYKLCPYGAIEMLHINKPLERSVIVTYQAHVIEALCKGCGTCASVCPVQAIHIPHFTNHQILEQINQLTKKSIVKEGDLGET